MSFRSRNGRILIAGGAIVIVAIAVALLIAAGDDAGEGSDPSPAAEMGFDADAKASVRTAQTALEVYATDNGGSYAGATPATLQEIEPSLPAGVEVLFVSRDSYSLRVISETEVAYSVIRSPTGVMNRRCDPPGDAGCPESGDW